MSKVRGLKIGIEGNKGRRFREGGARVGGLTFGESGGGFGEKRGSNGFVVGFGHGKVQKK